MINPENFIKRLEIILDYYSLNASAFADKIGVQRSSLSHLLSGRNKPSLDFILKILEVYPEIDLYWILNGKGTFPKSEHKTSTTTSASESNLNQKTESKLEKQSAAVDEKSSSLKSEVSKVTLDIKKQINQESNHHSEIDRIVIFYKNGTFTTYSPD